MQRALTIAIALSFLTACGADGADCELNSLARGNDGLYSGYEDCSEAKYPDFTDPIQRKDDTYAANCEGTSGEHAFACAEQVFWQAFQFDHDKRIAAYDALLDLTQREDAANTQSDERLAILYLRLGVFGTAIAMEQEDFSRARDILAHLQKAHDLWPDNPFIETWLITVDVGQNVALDGDYEPAILRLERLTSEHPQIVAGAFAAVASGLPMDTGWPQRAADIINQQDEIGCGLFCGWDAHRAPFTGPGAYFTYAEVMARVGDKDAAMFWLQLALDHERATNWPHKTLAQDSLLNIDSFVGKFAERPADENVTDLFVTSNKNSCMICHAPMPTK